MAVSDEVTVWLTYDVYCVGVPMSFDQYFCILESAVGFRKKLTQANKEKLEQAAKFNEEVISV